jgi:predicted acylesterase/phospholipase RssA
MGVRVGGTRTGLSRVRGSASALTLRSLPTVGLDRPMRVHLLLGAGGVRCLSYIGALSALEQAGHEIATVSTASAGTLVGALHCSGVTAEAMEDMAVRANLRRLSGKSRFTRLGWPLTLFSWPYNRYSEPGIAEVYKQIVEAAGGDADLTLGELKVPLSTAAVDVAGQRLLVYSTAEHPKMPVQDLLKIAVAIPMMYEPARRQQRQVMDASLASYAPIWLAAGQREDLPIVVLRTTRKRELSHKLLPWLTDVIQGGVVSRDTFELERMPRVTVHDIETDVEAFDFKLKDDQIKKLIATGRHTVVDNLERNEQTIVSPADRGDVGAVREAAGLYSRHLARLARDRTATVFISYAHEDVDWVTRLRSSLDHLIADARVDIWDDSYIKAGSVWRGAIEDAIERARVAVLLVSKDFSRSTFIRTTELELLRAAAADRGLPLLWIPIDRSPAPVHDIQGLWPPDRSLGSLSDFDADDALGQIARKIQDAYAEVVGSMTTTRSE